jgi:hypothetical protein
MHFFFMKLERGRDDIHFYVHFDGTQAYCSDFIRTSSVIGKSKNGLVFCMAKPKALKNHMFVMGRALNHFSVAEILPSVINGG